MRHYARDFDGKTIVNAIISPQEIFAQAKYSLLENKLWMFIYKAKVSCLYAQRTFVLKQWYSLKNNALNLRQKYTILDDFFPVKRDPEARILRFLARARSFLVHTHRYVFAQKCFQQFKHSLQI